LGNLVFKSSLELLLRTSAPSIFSESPLEETEWYFCWVSSGVFLMLSIEAFGDFLNFPDSSFFSSFFCFGHGFPQI